MKKPLQQSVVLAQALRHVKAGHPDQAEPLCRQALRANKKDVQAIGLLGQIAIMKGRFDEAVKHLQKCVALSPKQLQYHSMLAEALAAGGRYDEALDRYEKILKLNAQYTPAVSGKAEVLNRQSRHEEAAALLEPVIDQGGDDAGMAVVFLRAAARTGRYDKAVAVAARHAQNPDVSPEMKRDLLFALGFLHERAGEYDRAFDAYTRGNALSNRAYNHAENTARSDHIMATFTAAAIAAAPQPPHPSHLPVFIVGMMRSGSTLVEQIIAAHPAAHGAGELTTLLQIASSMPLTIGSTVSYPACVADLARNDVDKLSRQYLDHVRRLGRGAKRVTDKQLDNYLHVGLISILFPEARVIHCRRSPVDTCLSAFTQKFPPGIYGFTSDLRMLGQAYREYDRLMDYWRELAPVPMLEVQYEELVADQEAVSRRVIDFCGLPWDDCCLRYYETGRPVLTLSMNQVSQPIYRTSVGRADRFGHHLDPLREALAGK